ncbi:MAG: hypothetical protein GY725_03910 [bacterium]|nr:hypothetical protein [bacterium]
MEKLRFSTKFWFGFGQMAEGLKNTGLGFFLLLFYSQVLGLPPLLAGLAIFLALIVDAVTDPMAGSLSDAFRHRWGRRHPFLYASAIPLGIMFALVFRPPADLSHGLLFLWMLIFTVLTRLSMTLYHVPHMSLGAELSSDYHERTVVVAFRNFFGLLGAAILLISCALYFMKPTPEFENGQLNPAAYAPMGLFFGGLMTFSILFSALGTHSRIPHLTSPAEQVLPFSLRRLSGEVREALKNPSFRNLFIGLLLFFIARGTADSLGAYMGPFFWRLETYHAIMIGALSLLGMVVGTPIWAIAARPFDKKHVFIFGICWYSGLTAILPLLKMVDLFPANESALYVPTIYVFAFLAALGAAGSLIAAGSMMADITDEHELNTGRRQEGIFFGALAFSTKAAVGLGAGLASIALFLIQFPLQVSPEEVPASTVLQLAVVAGPGVAVLMGVGIAFLNRYNLTRERMSEVQMQISQRSPNPHTASAETPAPEALPAVGGGS